MDNQTDNTYHKDNSFNENGISSSQTNSDITIPKANNTNISATNSNLHQGFNNENHSSIGTNSQNLNHNPALGQRRMNNHPDLNGKDNSNSENNRKNNDKNNLEKNSNSKNDNQASDNNNKINRMPTANQNNNNTNLQSDNPNNRTLNSNDKNSDNGFNPRKNEEVVSKSNNRESNNQQNDNSSDNQSSNPLSNILNDSYITQEQKRKIIIGGSAVIVVLIIGAIIFISLIGAMTAILSSSMCDNGYQSSSFSSGDVLGFMCGMQSPLGDKSYTISAPAGEKRSYENHPGIDLAIGGGTPIYAVRSGEVIRAGWFGGYGNCVDIDHGNGIVTRYGHMQDGSIQVSKGDIINQGTRIGSVGTTGHSDGNHLHFEIIVNGNPVYDQNAYFDYRGTGGYEYNRNVSQSFMASCGSSASSFVYTSANSTTTTTQNAYDNIKTLKTISKSTGSTKSILMNGKNPQSFAYNNNNYYVQWISPGASGKDGYIHKYDSNISFKSSSSTSQAVGHGNGLAYSTADNMLYSVTVSGIRDNKKATIIDPNSLKTVGAKNLKHGTSAIAYDRLTNRFITSSGAADGKSSTTGYLYVYDSTLSKQVGAKSIAKKRWNTPGDIAAYGGIIYVCIHESVGKNYIDMYNEDTGEYLGSYNAPYSEIEGIDINDNEEIVLLFHNSNFIQFTGIKANVINRSSGNDYTQSSNECCVTGGSSYTTYSSSSSDYCPNGITVTGKDAGTYELDEYVERVVTAENGGAHPEALKALAIAARTYALNRTDNCKNSIVNSTAAQVMADKASDKVKNALQSVKGSVMLYNGNYFSAQYSSFYGKCEGEKCTSTFIKSPSQETGTFTMPYTYLTTAPNAGHEYGLSQNGSNYMASVQGKTYDEILKFFYADGIEITGVSSSGNSCSLGGSGTYKNGKIWDYNQADYSDAYCGGTIADSGCGPTAMAMVVSTLLNEKHDPSELAKASSVCSTQNHQYFIDAAKKYGLKAVTTQDHEEVMTALNRGDSLVIANVTNETVDGLDNFWTEGGHYIVLAGHDGRDVWVQDPNKGIASVHRTNTKGDGVYNFDKYIKPATTIGYIIIKKA